jgi:hypothetical protein
MEENNIEFGKWVTTHREALANLYFSFFESVMGDQVRNDEEGDIIPLDEFVVKIYSENKDIVELWYVKNNKENPEEDLGFGNELDFSRN